MASTTSHSPSAPPFRAARALPLACRECQRKKTRCDRTYPCTPCTRGGIPCVPSTRKPRTKAGAKAVDAELRSRIAKLERLVESFQGEEPNPTSSNGSISPKDAESSSSPPLRSRTSDACSATSPASPNTTKYIAGTFWHSLTAEVHALREAFDDDEEGSDAEAESSDPSPASQPQPFDPYNAAAAGYELLLCPPGSVFVMPGALNDPDDLQAEALWQVFLEHVEPVYKFLHVPTLRAFMERGEPLYGQDAESLCNKALRAAIYFAAAVAMTESECQVYFSKPRDQVVSHFRKHVDLALHAADSLNTNDLATLQAMGLYITSLRVIDSSRRAWSLMGLLVRIARGSYLHREIPGESIYIAELRRRLWHNLVFLDCYSSVDRGSEPAIHPDSFSRLPPTHCNDSDFGPDSIALIPREGEVTDMTVARVSQEGSPLVLRLSSPEDAVSSETWQQRLESAYNYQRSIQTKYLQYCDPAVPRHLMILGIGYAASHSIILRAVRPIHCSPTSIPPRVDSPWVLQLAVNILRHCDRATNCGKLDGWRLMPWVPWHAIAVALAGLCSIRGTPLADEAWGLVDRSMAYNAAMVADSRNGLLWKPLERLRRKAAVFRDQSSMPTAPPSQPNFLPDIDPAAPSIPDGSQHQRQQQQQQQTLPPGDTMATYDLGFDEEILLPDAGFAFSAEMLSSLPPADASWFDWESMVKDMDDTGMNGMQMV